MKNSLLIRLFVAVFSILANIASAQNFAVDYSASNGQDKIVVNSTIKNMPANSKGVRVVEISNNSSMTPLLDGKTDSVFHGSDTVFTDEFSVSLQSPIMYYVRETVKVFDTAGNIYNAKAVNYKPVFITPAFKKPTCLLNKILVSQNTATISGNFTSGFDTAKVEIIVSYGDSSYSNPSTKYPYTGTVVPKVGSNQVNALSFTIPLGVQNYLFSYRVKVSNSAGDTLSPVMWSRTLSTPGPAMVGSPYNLQGWADSVVFYDQTVSSGLATTHTAYIAKNKTAMPFDSIVVKIGAGNAEDTVIRNLFSGLSSETDYWVWSQVSNSMNTVPFTSNRMFVQTTKKAITIFSLKIDSTKSVNPTDQGIYWEAQTPPGENGHVIILGRTYPNGQVVVLEDATVTGYKNGKTTFPNCIQGQKYEITIYGYDDDFTASYDAWIITDTFTFYPNLMASAKVLGKETLKVYPNPCNEFLNVPSAEQWTIFSSTGQLVKTGNGSTVDVSTLQNGVYTILTETGFARFVKN